ncbi:hypothetical protein [Pseudomonas alliivorans]|uniref:hypothetical protein n=1 Tax=Pseudomonas alliivorans TaxID=2810613 RepID=UPI00403A943F
MSTKLFSVAIAFVCVLFAGLVVIVTNEIFNGGVSGAFLYAGKIMLVISCAALVFVFSMHRLDSLR